MADYTYTGGKFVPTAGGTTIDPASGFTSTLVSRAAGSPTKIMAVGDSITLGQGSERSGGWRMFLWQMLTDAGFYLTPVGWNTANPIMPYDVTYPRRGSGHASYGGWKIQDHLDQVAGRTGRAAGSPLGSDGIGAWITTYNPDLLIVNLGTNNAAVDPSTVRQQAMSDFATAVFAAKPTVNVVWGTMPYQQNNQTTYPVSTEWQTEWAKWTGKKIVRAEVATRLGIVSENFYDMLHPSIYGYERIATALFDAIVAN